jgi:hypothetical protein
MEVPGVDAQIKIWGNSLLLATENFISPATVGLMLVFYHWGEGWGGGVSIEEKHFANCITCMCHFHNTRHGQ